MKIVIQQSKLLDILTKLYVDGLFPFSVITTKNGKLISSQSDKDEFAYRYVQFLPSYFKELSTEEESVKIDVEKIKGFASLRKADDVLTLEYPSPDAPNKLRIKDSVGVTNNIAVVKVSEEEIKTGLPFVMKDGIPHMREGTVALDTNVKISVGSFRLIDEYAKKHGTEFYRYQLGEDRKLRVLVGDIHSIEDSTEIKPICQVIKVGESLDTVFTKGIREITKVFSRDVNVFLRSNFPGWFSEVSQDHKFGVSIAPYINKEE